MNICFPSKGGKPDSSLIAALFIEMVFGKSDAPPHRLENRSAKIKTLLACS